MSVKFLTDKDEKAFVKTINGKKPDENGNVNVAGDSGGGSGEPGADGFSPIANVTQTASGAVISITDKNGTTTATITNGKDGAKGDKGDSIKGDKGDTGSAGADGVSVSSVKQTTTSSADGGSNVVTVTLSNGTTSTFTVKNGSKGSTGAAGKDGSDAAVTAANIASALGYTPADEADVAVLLDALDTVQTVIPSININDGVYEYGRFATAGTEWDKDAPITGAFRNANYLPVTGGRTMTVYFDAFEWNNNNKGQSVEIVEYDANKNIIGGRRSVSTYTASRDGFTLDASTAYIRLCINRAGTAIETPLDEIEMALYYIEDAQLSFVPYEPTIVEETVLNTEAVSVLRGKKIVYDGDSICESRNSGTAANGGGYAKLIADKVGGIYTNQAVGGARLCAHSEKHSVVNNLANLPADGDLYCFQGGINDFWGNTAIGTCSATDYTGTLDTSTICGALETIFRHCLTNFLGKPICFVITHKVQNTGHTANSDGKTFKDYRDAMMQVCEKYSIPYYDAFAESGLNGWNTAQSNAFLTANSSGTGDGTHPNEEGYKRYYVPQLISLFEKIFPAQ